ncbi:MAG TPA: hypothetical protein VEM40_11235 [Nitrospirota bacterium]|nr:hypothetical protein [Nitrospirota bacterium]
MALTIVLASLAAGIAGYHYFEGLPWMDAFVNAAMILGGMGPVNELHTTAGKLFAGCYALYSGMVFLVAAGVLFAPVVHRFLHHFHLEISAADTKQDLQRQKGDLPAKTRARSGNG